MIGRNLLMAGLATLLLAVTLSPAVLAEAGDQRVRAGLVYAVPTDERTDGSTTTELDEALGFHVGYEYALADKVGLEVVCSVLKHDVTVSEPAFPDQNGEIDVTTVNLNLNFLLVDEGPATFYLGPTVGYALWDDLELDIFADEFPTDDKFIYGANLGVDVPFGKGRWSFSGALNFLFSEVSLEGGSDIAVDPIHVRAGVAYKF